MTFCCEEFYGRNAGRYADVAGRCLQSVAIDSTHPRLTGDWDLIERLIQLAPGRRGLDAGCGAGARDVRRILDHGFDMTGIDAVPEVVRVTHAMYPELEERVLAADLRNGLPFEDGAFDFALCVSVLQHIEARVVRRVALPELARVLRPGGVLLLAFKRGSGIAAVYDRHYEEERHFLLHDEHEVLEALRSCGMDLVPSRSADELGGLMYCSDVKGLRYCAFFAGKRGSALGESAPLPRSRPASP
jgi:SAM-dependent methyltransferase